MDTTSLPPGGAALDPAEVAEAFAGVLDCEPEQRAALLLAIGARNPRLGAEVESLLRAHAAAATFLAGPVALPVSSPGLDAAPERIGPYRVLAELGRGGMGTVYLAERIEGGFEQRVALKLVRRGLVSDALRARFLRERQILARLEHPNIARLLDGGLSEDGSPYFAMELVQGSPLIDSCAARGLGEAARLELFAQACQAVQHAHAHLVVHRDLKPSNMVVSDDGTLKLLDFGIAKILSDSDEGDELTRAGFQPLTPAYAAPEQLRGQDATVATDVYALGVVLHELLVGARPSDAESAAKRPRLGRDLGAILERALERDPARRYPSVEALAEDLRRLRDGLPVRAREATMGYRLGKLVRRHRVAFAAGGAALAALVAGLVVSLWQARIAARERDAARTAAERAEEVQRFLVGLFEGADPANAKGDEITARELLERGVARVDGELAGQPEVQAALLDSIARADLSLGRYEQGRALAERELELLRRLRGERHVEVARALNLLGNALFYGGDRKQAAERYREALVMRQELLGENHADVAQSLNDLAIVLGDQAKLEESEQMFRRALAIFDALGRRDEEYGTYLSNLGNLLSLRGKLSEADAVQRQAMEIWKRELGETHPLIAAGLSDLARVQRLQGKLEEAERLERESVAQRERLLGPDHHDLGVGLHNLARTLMEKRDFAAAEHTLRRALEVFRRSVGEEHRSYAVSLDFLAITVAEQGRAAEALPYFRRSVALLKRVRGANHPTVANSLRRQGEVLLALDRRAEALACLDESLAILRARPDTTPDKLAPILALREKTLAAGTNPR